MSANHNDLHLSVIKQFLHYDHATGIFTWRTRSADMFPLCRDCYREREARRWNSRFAGGVAGKICGGGYLQTSINGKSYMLHRLAWTWMTGVNAPDQIDHIDGDKTNNRWSNIRPATAQQNIWNRGASKASKTGFKGVCHRFGRFQAQIRIDGKTISLGWFDTAEDAYDAYKSASLSHHGDYSFFSREGAAA